MTKLEKREYDKQYRAKNKESIKNKKRNPKGLKRRLVYRIYSLQVASSTKRKHPEPNYTKEKLYEWILKQPNFNSLVDNWVKSNYETNLIPSCDRLDNYKPYTLDNLRLVTWGENNKKGHSDRKNGINNKQNKAVLQLDKDGNFIKEYHSMRQAERETGFAVSDISRSCKGLNKKTYSYTWKYV